MAHLSYPVDVPAPWTFCAPVSQSEDTLQAALLVHEQVRQLQPGAVASWWQPGHPGWAIYPVDSEQFMSTGALESVSVPNEQIVAPQPQMGGNNLSILPTNFSFC